MTKKVKKILSLLLVIVMIMSSVPMMSFALNVLCDLTGEHSYEWKVTTPATCISNGVETYACVRSGCGVIKDTRVIEALGGAHKEIEIPAKEPTCDTDGNTAGKICSVCNTVIISCQTIPAKGHIAVSFDAVAATCTTNGNTAGTKCEICGKILTGGLSVSAMGHDYKLVSYKAGSCTTQGREEYECKICGDTKVTVLEAEHNFGAWVTVKVSTCIEVGQMERSCRSCTAKEVKTIDKLDHTEVFISGKNATCTETGITEGKKCSVCETVIEGCVVIPAKGHTEVVVKGTPATCGVKGTTDGSYCSVCNMVLKEQMVLAALEHIMVADTAASKAATCTTEGVKVERCSRVGCTYIVSIVIPKTHKADWTINTAATCTKDGKQSGYCTVCKETVVETIPATGHKVTNAAAWITKVEATCKSDGQRVATCSKCGDIVTEIIPATGHAYGEWIVTKSATCAATGIKKAVCKVCKDEQTKTIDRLAHTEIIIPAIEATCTKEGYTRGIECAVCGAEIKKVEKVSAKEHNYQSEWQTIIASSCKQSGTAIKICKDCFNITTISLNALPHKDENKDDKCDMCSVDMTAGSPKDECSCNCHKNGINSMLFKFILFFQKLLRQNKYCNCGVAHY